MIAPEVATPSQTDLGPAHHARALVVTADRCLIRWARERLRAAGMSVCDEAADLESAIHLAGEHLPDVCLLDVALPGGAIPALQRIRERAPTTRIVILAPSVDDPVLLPAVYEGVNGCMIGTPDGPALGRALADVLSGHTALPRVLLTRLVAALRPV
jgi:DNA-binding NarL/FixJ family response regulator